MSRREERIRELKEKAQQYHKQAERQTTVSVWDKDPIKQYIRRFGWLEVIKDYMERRRNDGVDRPLKYFTLPGPNASDIGLLAQTNILNRTSEGFPYVTICDETSAEQVQANLGRFQGVSSLSFHKAVKWPKGELCPFFPFDVINLDFSGALITRGSDRIKALKQIIGIRSIIRLQRGQGFLLLLTASADDELARDKLEEFLVNNLNEEDEFKNVYLERFNVLNPEPFMEDYRALVQVVLPKLIALLARDFGYKVFQHFIAKYDRLTHKMICHSLEFEFLGRIKAEKKYEPYIKKSELNGVSEILPSLVLRKALDTYTSFIPTLLQNEPKYVNAILENNPNLNADLTEEAKTLVGWWESS